MLTPQEILQKQFKIKLKGYDIQEVTGFLEQVSKEYESLLLENQFLKEELEKSKVKLKEAEEVVQRAQDVIKRAEMLAEKYITSAYRELERVLKSMGIDINQNFNEGGKHEKTVVF